MPHILVIEDDPRIRGALTRALGARGHSISDSATALAGLQRALDDKPDLVLLDLGLPDLDGLELLRMLRAVSAVPVIVATARDDNADVIVALDAGADDYVTKPFNTDQLAARIAAVLRRGADRPGEAEPLAVGSLQVDLPARRVTLDGTEVDLSPKEFDLLAYLAARPGVVVSKRELLAQVWRMPYAGADKTVDVHLSWLRSKLGESAQRPGYLQTVRGVGIRLAAPQ
ncbi:DNA-binding response regulator, OmpR family, contains REC and winged-helix (wHTH) domain [Nakamurella panacisegetis]|uniref:DNA-binding response regulator, OmpR family, contains REC and winged-helix (WHTH) domain n=1 Tax=Nakamurella panacisegetis TaxID=1090615 RepID=A0A1H0KY39_9ACTN|nr:response regulator transcription factor [Nakamurella panacisegetis]SDO60944.1 DNA-binding response regulator, OmpR family, contains REC and winged-helix (wHTH) domain [Nakamurella panacisegetis]